MESPAPIKPTIDHDVLERIDVRVGTIEAVVEFHPPVSVAEFASRKALAEFCHRRISGGVARALSGRGAIPTSIPEMLPHDAVDAELPVAAIG